MKGDPKVIQVLNSALERELTAINQYFLHARMCKSWGYHRIAEIVRKESIDEMKHASDLADRILFLEGVPNFQKLGKLGIGETVEEQLRSDLRLEQEAIAGLREAIPVCAEASDYTSRELLEGILADEERHVDWIEEQLGLIETIGYANYLSQNMA